MDLNSKIFTMVLGGLVVFVLLGSSVYLFYQSVPENDFPTGCTKNVKVCPDGTAVSRQGPKCEFSACPEIVGVNSSTSITTNELCVKDGGKWQTVGMLGTYRCIHSFSDGGKPCKASSECQSKYCVASFVSNEGVGGTCKPDDNPFGCSATVEDMKAGKPIMCVD